ncbi:hypothetical protein OsI_22409 [Oryza sativa Indica Group]|uniref:Uncharacterized protein n=1 Tax=Oryza sativa subsp. indica TaxID=39946 RepID=A2YBD3_ORYSI|nr:hypothetical protein OsI_22409 [Oryza sativa Indica Group]
MSMNARGYFVDVLCSWSVKLSSERHISCLLGRLHGAAVVGDLAEPGHAPQFDLGAVLEGDDDVAPLADELMSLRQKPSRTCLLAADDVSDDMSVQPQQVDAQRIEGLRCGGEEFRAEVGGGNAADEVNQTRTHHRRRIRMGMGDGDGALLQRKPLKCHILQQGLAQRSLTVGCATRIGRRSDGGASVNYRSCRTRG